MKLKIFCHVKINLFLGALLFLGACDNNDGTATPIAETTEFTETFNYDNGTTLVNTGNWVVLPATAAKGNE